MLWKLFLSSALCRLLPHSTRYMDEMFHLQKSNSSSIHRVRVVDQLDRTNNTRLLGNNNAKLGIFMNELDSTHTKNIDQNQIHDEMKNENQNCVTNIFCCVTLDGSSSSSWLVRSRRVKLTRSIQQKTSNIITSHVAAVVVRIFRFNQFLVFFFAPSTTRIELMWKLFSELI